MKQNRQEKRVKIVLCGYYGHGNFGDEAILAVLKQKIGVIFEVFASENARKRTGEEKRACKICILNTKNPVKIAKMLCGADLFVFGGGSLLQDSTSTASLLYYIALIRLARRLARRTVMLANGIGPIN
ncbi:MAG: polysaccharide pyruvyl transferase family protein [Eubacteriales bacterium]